VQTSEQEKVTKDKESHYVMKGSILREDITSLINTHWPNNSTSKYMRQKLTELK